MSDKTGIEWTDATWNPLRGCTRVSEGCRNCYAERVAARFSGPGHPYEGLVERTSKGPRWTGKVALVESALDQPLRWRKPRRIFVNSMSDLFHEAVPDEWIDRIFGVIGANPQHIYQVLTKRPARMRDYLARRKAAPPLQPPSSDGLLGYHPFNSELMPPAYVWLGVSVEDQPTADARIPELLATPAAVRFVSAEPLLGPVDLTSVWARMPGGGKALWNVLDKVAAHEAALEGDVSASLDWLIVGGESGPGARPMQPDWARSLRDQCAAAGVPFFFKQWGEWAPHPTPGQGERPIKVGKRAAGRLLDGRTHDAMPGDTR